MTRLNVTVAGVALFAGSVYLAEKPLVGDVSDIQVTARKYEFSPNVIKAKRGDHVRLVIHSARPESRVQAASLHINQKLEKGEAVTVEFTADLAGTFGFECSHFCGLGHQKMKGQLTVE